MGPIPWRRCAALGAIGLVLAAALMGMHAHEISQFKRFPGTPNVLSFTGTHETLDALLALGDGQAYAALARDPTLAHPEAFTNGPKEAAYRAQRPLFSYLIYVASLGNPDWVPGAMVALVLIAAGLAITAIAALIASRGGHPALALLSLLFPGSLSTLHGFTPELLAMAFMLFGIIAWNREAFAPATAFATLSVLTRESMILVPIAMLLPAIIRRTCRGHELTFLLTPAAAFVAWALIVEARFGIFPTSSGVPDALSAPFVGFAQAVSEWSDPPLQTVNLLLGALLLTGALYWGRRDFMTRIACVYAVFGTVMGVAVWRRWQDFGRPLLPMYVFAWIVIASSPIMSPSYTFARDSHPPHSPRINR